jgi:hypothetical protein
MGGEKGRNKKTVLSLPERPDLWAGLQISINLGTWEQIPREKRFLLSWPAPRVK